MEKKKLPLICHAILMCPFSVLSGPLVGQGFPYFWKVGAVKTEDKDTPRWQYMTMSLETASTAVLWMDFLIL